MHPANYARIVSMMNICSQTVLYFKIAFVFLAQGAKHIKFFTLIALFIKILFVSVMWKVIICIVLGDQVI